MNAITQSMVILCGGMLITGMGQSAFNESILQSYMGIVERNAFGLKDPPPPVNESAQQKQPPVNIVLTGISNDAGSKKAFFKIPGKDANSSKNVTLKEGEQDEQIKILEGGIDELAGTVKILNAGVALTLDFDKNGNKQAVSGLPPTMAPGMVPGAPNSGIVPPGVRQPAGVTHGVPVGVPVQFPTLNPGVAPAAQAIPTRNLRTQQTPQQDTANFVQSQLSMELQRQLNADAIAAGDHPPLPPTEFSDATSGSTATPTPTVPTTGVPRFPNLR